MESGNSGIEPGLSGDVGAEESNSFLPRKVLELYVLSYPLTILPYSLVFEGVSHDMLLIPALFFLFCRKHEISRTNTPHHAFLRPP